MAITKYKASTEYRDPTTGTIYLDSTAKNKTTQNTNTPSDVYQQTSKATNANNNSVTSPASTNSSNSTNYSPKTTTSTKKSYESDFVPSELTSHYKSEMLDTDDDRPSAYKSKYQTTIDNILETINNKQKFDISSDTNYNKLYEQQKERYTASADKAMRDTLASANASTGGYGSSYGQVAAQQAYDNTMQGLNDNNVSLMQLAYSMYADDVANDYNKLSAYQNEDNTLYSRYRDTVSDWQADRDYYANQYWNSFGTDRSAYESDRSFDYGKDQDSLNREYEEYQNALSTALTLAQNGQSVPSSLTEIIDKYNSNHGLSGDTASSLSSIASQVASDKAAQIAAQVAAAQAKAVKSSDTSSSKNKNKDTSSKTSNTSSSVKSTTVTNPTNGTTNKVSSVTSLLNPFYNANVLTNLAGSNALQVAQNSNFVPTYNAAYSSNDVDADDVYGLYKDYQSAVANAAKNGNTSSTLKLNASVQNAKKLYEDAYKMLSDSNKALFKSLLANNGR